MAVSQSLLLPHALTLPLIRGTLCGSWTLAHSELREHVRLWVLSTYTTDLFALSVRTFIETACIILRLDCVHILKLSSRSVLEVASGRLISLASATDLVYESLNALSTTLCEEIHAFGLIAVVRAHS